jgi:hypothetical protein
MTVGIMNTNQLAQDLKKLSFSATIMRFMPQGQAPLFGLTSQLKEETAAQPVHGFFSKTMLFPEFTLAADITTTETLWTVVSTVNLIPGQMHQVNVTGENVIIDNVVGSNQIRVSRAIGTVAAQAASSGAAAYQVGNAFEEGSQRPAALSINPVQMTNFTQIFRDTWGVTGSVAATEVIAGESTVSENKMDCAGFHAAAIEKALFFGQKYQGTRNGQPFRAMDGLISIVSNLAYYPAYYSSPNVTTAGSTTNWTQLEAMFNPTLDQATDPKIANKRIVYVGSQAKTVLNNIGRVNSQYQMMNGATSYGLQFATFNTSRGEFTVIEHPLFNTNPAWKKMAVVIDLSTFNIAYLGDRKTQNKEFNVQGNIASDNGIDAVGGTLTTECTCLVKNPPANAVIYNLTAAAVG